MIKSSVRISVPPLDPEPGDDRAVDLGAGGQPLLRPLPGRDPRGRRRPGVPDGGGAPPRRRLRRPLREIGFNFFRNVMIWNQIVQKSSKSYRKFQKSCNVMAKLIK